MSVFEIYYEEGNDEGPIDIDDQLIDEPDMEMWNQEWVKTKDSNVKYSVATDVGIPDDTLITVICLEFSDIFNFMMLNNALSEAAEYTCLNYLNDDILRCLHSIGIPAYGFES